MCVDSNLRHLSWLSLACNPALASFDACADQMAESLGDTRTLPWQHLDVSASSLGPSALAFLAEHTPRLECLDVSGCLALHAEAFLDFVSSPQGPVALGSLTSLHVDGLGWFTDTAFIGLVNHVSSGLLSRFHSSKDHLLAVDDDCSSVSPFLDPSLPSTLSRSAISIHCAGTMITDRSFKALHLAAADDGVNVFTFQELSLSRVNQITPLSLKLLLTEPSHSLISSLSVLDLSSAANLRGPEAATPISSLIHACAASLLSLNLNFCYAGASVVDALVTASPNRLTRLSIIGSRSISNDTFATLASIPSLAHLAVGGANLAWAEERALTGFSQLTALEVSV